MPLASWRVTDNGPVRLSPGAVELEKHLEDWIENDPSLVDPGLLVVGRQLQVEGGILDLLCVDPQGRATVIEIKKGKLIRDTIAQGIDYASSIARMPTDELHAHVQLHLNGVVVDHPGVTALLDPDSDDERDVAVIVVGIGADPGLERIIDHLGSRYGLPISAVSFDVFDLGDGQRVLVREITEPEQVAPKPTQTYTRDGVIATVGGPASDVGKWMIRIAETAEELGLYVRPWKWSLMLAPPSSKNRALVVFGRFWGGETLAIQHYPDTISEFYGVDTAHVRSILGPGKEAYPITDDGIAEDWLRRLRTLFEPLAPADSAG